MLTEDLGIEENREKSMNKTCLSTLFHRNDDPGLKSVRGMSQGPPADSRAGFFGARWLMLRGPYGCPRTFQGPETPQGAGRGALRRSGTPFSPKFLKIK